MLAAGIRVYPERDGFLIANGHPRPTYILAGTEWLRTYGRLLRRLPGAAGTGTARFEGINRRGTLVPAALLDEDGW